MAKKFLISAVLLVAAFAMCAVACTPAGPNQNQGDVPDPEPAIVIVTHVSVVPSEFDSQCLSCHISYEAVAEKTAHYGDSNPHDGIHSGYFPCSDCHATDKVVNEDHKCITCHAWPRPQQSKLPAV